MNGKTVIYPGSFDPFTNGHLNIIARASRIFEKIIISAGHNTSKKTILSIDERVSLIKEVTKDYPNVEVESFQGLLVDYVREKETNTILRGMRCHSDFEYELQMATANKLMDENVETLFMLTESRFSHISSSLIKEIISLGGSARHLVPEAVEKKLIEKLFGDTKTETVKK